MPDDMTIDAKVAEIDAEIVDDEPILTPKAKRPKNKFSDTLFREIKEYSSDVIMSLATRDADFDVKERCFLIAPLDKSEGDARVMTAGQPGAAVAHAKTMFDPTAQTVVKKMVGMFMQRRNAFPTLSVRNDNAGDPDKVERFVRGLLRAQPTVSSASWILNGFYSYAIFGEASATIINRMISDPNARVPFVYKVPHPRQSYPVYATGEVGGLYRHIVKTTTTYGEACLDYPGAEKVIGLEDDDDIIVVDYICRRSKLRVVWIEEHDDVPILWQPLPDGLDVLPRVARLAQDAPDFFEDEADRRHGLLNAYVKSGIWAAFNVGYSIMYSNIFDYVNPDLEVHGENEQRARQIRSQIDWAQRPMILEMTNKENVTPMQKQLVPPELMSFLQMAGYLRGETMVPPIASGDWRSTQIASSGLHLLSENATRAVNFLAESMGLLVSDAVNASLQWARAGEYRPRVWTPEGVVELQPSDIGDCFVECTFTPDRTAEQQIKMGLVNAMSGLRMGEKDWLPLLEQAQLVDSASEALDRMYERAVNDAERMAVSKTVLAEAQRLNEAIAKVPSGLTEMSGQLPMPLPMGDGIPSGNNALPIMPTQSAPMPQMPAGLVAPDVMGGAPPGAMPGDESSLPDLSSMLGGGGTA